MATLVDNGHLFLALVQVHRVVAGRAVAGMARDLGPAVRHFLAQHALQERRGHVLEVGDPPLPLRVEAADEAHPAIPAERDSERLHQLLEELDHTGLAVRVAMGVHVRRRAPHQLVEPRELAAKLVAHRALVPQIELALVLAPHVPVQAHGEVGMIARQRRRLLARPARHHEAGARDHTARVGSARMRLDNAAVDAGGRAEVIGVDDEVPHAAPTSASRRPATLCASRYSSAISRAARQWLA